MISPTHYKHTLKHRYCFFLFLVKLSFEVPTTTVPNENKFVQTDLTKMDIESKITFKTMSNIN